MKIIIVLLAGLAVGAARAGSTIDEQVEADPAGEVEISNVAGSVEVSGWEQNRIQVTGELGDGSERLDVIREDDRTLIKVVLPEDDRRVDGTDLIVKVPAASSLVVTAVSADIAIKNVRGGQRLQTVSGDVVTDSWQDCEAKTVSGDVVVTSQGEGSMLTITAVSGDLALTVAGGELTATTVSGDLDVEARDVNRARIRTTNGDIDVNAQLSGGGLFDAETINGDVDLKVNGKDDLDVNVETFNGSIENCFGVDVVKKSRYGPGHELRFNTGNGGREIRIKTMNGDVDVCGQ